jgi:yeast amino acid transporter
MVSAVFAYSGTELVGVTFAEAQNPRKTIPKAIRLTFYRILFFYIASVILLGMLVPYNSTELAFANKSSNSAAASPYVVAIKLAGIKVLPGLLNGCICLFVFSAANSDLYIASRTIYGLASEGRAPSIFVRTNARGLPYVGLGVSAMFCLLAYMNVTDDSRTVFIYFQNLTTIFGLETWISILVTHIFFVKARKAQGIPNSAMPYVAPLGIWGSYFSLFLCIIVAFTKNFAAFTHGSWGDFDYKTFITGYLGIPLYLILIFGYKFWTKCARVTAHDADFYTGKDIIDREEEEFLARKAAMQSGKKDGSWFYRHFVSWLF